MRSQPPSTDQSTLPYDSPASSFLPPPSSTTNRSSSSREESRRILRSESHSGDSFPMSAPTGQSPGIKADRKHINESTTHPSPTGARVILKLELKSLPRCQNEEILFEHIQEETKIIKGELKSMLNLTQNIESKAIIEFPSYISEPLDVWKRTQKGDRKGDIPYITLTVSFPLESFYKNGLQDDHLCKHLREVCICVLKTIDVKWDQVLSAPGSVPCVFRFPVKSAPRLFDLKERMIKELKRFLEEKKIMGMPHLSMEITRPPDKNGNLSADYRRTATVRIQHTVTVAGCIIRKLLDRNDWKMQTFSILNVQAFLLHQPTLTNKKHQTPADCFPKIKMLILTLRMIFKHPCSNLVNNVLDYWAFDFSLSKIPQSPPQATSHETLGASQKLAVGNSPQASQNPVSKNFSPDKNDALHPPIHEIPKSASQGNSQATQQATRHGSLHETLGSSQTLAVKNSPQASQNTVSQNFSSDDDDDLDSPANNEVKDPTTKAYNEKKSHHEKKAHHANEKYGERIRPKLTHARPKPRKRNPLVYRSYREAARHRSIYRQLIENAQIEEKGERNRKIFFHDEEIKRIKQLSAGGKTDLWKASIKDYKGIGGSDKVFYKIVNGTMDEYTKEFSCLLFMRERLHENVVKFIGATAPPVQGFLFEFCELGSLDNLHNNLDLDLRNWRTFYRIALHMFRGLRHLKENNILHRDIACRNLVMTADFRVKITDFGLSVIPLDGPHRHRGDENLPLNWMSPEALRHKTSTHKSDVWSAGVALWEILTKGKVPYYNLNRDLDIVIKEVGEGKLTLEDPKDASSDQIHWMRQCLQFHPEKRPSASTLVDTLEEFITKKLTDSLLDLALDGGDDKGLTLALDVNLDLNTLRPRGKNIIGYYFGPRSTLLHVGLEKAEIPFIKRILEGKATVNLQDGEGNTPLHVAVEKNDMGVVRLLLQAQADVNSIGLNRRRPLHNCVSGQVVNLLISKGANVEAKDANGSTPLHVAVESGNHDVVRCLLNAKAKCSYGDMYRIAELVPNYPSGSV